MTTGMAITYRKTAKGLAEIETRAHRLPPRMRAALIVVDGRRGEDELCKLIPQQPDETLRALQEQGFIEVVSAAALPSRPGSAAAPVTSAPTAPPRPVVDFDRRRREAVRRFTDQVGPMGEALAIRMERAGNADDLRPLVGMAVQVIGNTRGRQAAADYQALFSDL
jgi:hypothetical protein